MTSIPKCWSGECAGRSILQRYPPKVSSSALISAASPNPIEARVTGGSYCDPKISRFASKRPPETSMSSSRLTSRLLPRCGSDMRDLQPRLRAEKSPCKARRGQSQQRAACSLFPTNQSSRVSDFQLYNPPALSPHNSRLSAVGRCGTCPAFGKGRCGTCHADTYY